MRKAAALLMVMLIILGLSACDNDDSDRRERRSNRVDSIINEDTEFAKTIKDEKLVIGYTIYEPMNYMEDGKLTGFDTEFAEAVCEKLGKTPEFVEINWDKKFQILDSDQIDCIWNGMTISPEVRKNCAVSNAYVKNAQVVVMAKDKIDQYTDAESMKDLKFTAEAGSAGEEAIKASGLDKNYVEAQTRQQAFMALKGGQADACVIDITYAKELLKNKSNYMSFAYCVELTSEEYGIGFRTSDVELKENVNKAIAELKADGTLDKLARKYNVNLAL